MQRLFQLLYKYRAFILFLLLEVLSGWMVIQNNQYQGAAFFNSANSVSGTLINTTDNFSQYISLKKVNEDLVSENAILRNQLGKNTTIFSQIPDLEDLEITNQYFYLPAKVINNTTRRVKNYLTIDKGSRDGVKPGMGVIGTIGAVGMVKAVSNRFSTIISLLHTDVLISSTIRASRTICSTKWDGLDPLSANLLFVPRHIQVNVGDTISTSGYNSVFPENVLIGTISEVNLKDDATFYDIKIRLSTSFQSLSYVYVVNNNLKAEKDSLEVNSLL